MKRCAMQSFLIVCLLLSGLTVAAQDNTPVKEDLKGASSRADGPQLRVQVLFSEYEGDKKVKSLPYTLLVLAGTNAEGSKFRIGDRVPVASGKEGGGAIQFQYIDVGTNIDCKASSASEGRFLLRLDLERSAVQSDVGDLERSAVKSDVGIGSKKAAITSDDVFREPTIRAFRSATSVILRDGQTVESIFATDPLTGRIIKLEITLSVLK